MLSHRFARTSLVAAAALVALASSAPFASAQYGFNDPSFNPADDGTFGDGTNGQVEATAIQPDGKLVIVGVFFNYNTTSRKYIARLNTDGSLDSSFQTNPGADWHVRTVALQPDGKMLVSGDFSNYDGIARKRIARIHGNGSVDASFDSGAGPNNTVLAYAVQPDGKIVVGGGFTVFDGIPRGYIARLHADGSLDPSFAVGVGADSAVTQIVRLSDGKLLIGGYFTSYGGAPRGRIARLESDGQLDLTFDPGAGLDNTVRAVELLSDGRILVGGVFSTYNAVARNRVARLHSNGALDTSFDPGAGLGVWVTCIAVQSDGRVLVGGNSQSSGVLARLFPDGSPDNSLAPNTGAGNSLSKVHALPDGKLLVAGDTWEFGVFQKRGVARLHVDGTADLSFNALPGPSDTVGCIIRQPDGKHLIAGNFRSYSGIARRGIARVQASGDLDPSFDTKAGPNSAVSSVALQPDGRIVVAGGFTTFDDLPRNRIARLESDGSVDPGFDAGAGPNFGVSAVALQPDGKIVIGGTFTEVDGFSRFRVARLNANGSVDSGFDPGIGVGNYYVDVLAIQPDGRIVIGGEFTSVGGAVRHRLARLNSDGTLDTSFAPSPGADWVVRCIALQPDGKLLIGGPFWAYNGVSTRGIARVNPDGSLDTSFDPGPGVQHHSESAPAVYSIALQPDSRILIAGNFTSAAGRPRRSVARLFADGSLDNSFDGLPGAGRTVSTLALEPSGRALLGGQFTSFDGAVRHRVARMIAYSPTPLSYCTAGTSTNGCAPTVDFTGTPSIASASGFTLDVTGVEGQRQGLIFYGIGGRKADAWSPGSTSVLCVKAPMQRMNVASTGGTSGQCDGALSTDWLAYVSANPTAVGAPFAAGVTVSAQGWFRDPPAPKSTSLSNALEFVTAP